jgi:hypothetical protein
MKTKHRCSVCGADLTCQSFFVSGGRIMCDPKWKPQCAEGKRPEPVFLSPKFLEAADRVMQRSLDYGGSP